MRSQKVANLQGKTVILNFLSHCQFKDFNAYFPLKKFQHQTTNIDATKMGTVCVEFFALSAHVFGMIFRALHQKILGQTTKCGPLSRMG